METTAGVSLVSCTAVVSASRKPWSVFGAKYIAIFAEGATAPADFDIEFDFAIGAVGIARRRICCAIHGDSGDGGRRDAEIFEISGEIRCAVAAG